MKTAFVGDSLNYFNLGQAHEVAHRHLECYLKEDTHSTRRRLTTTFTDFCIKTKGSIFVENGMLYVLISNQYRYEFLPWKSMKEKKINLP